jgi:hypothetical protein
MPIAAAPATERVAVVLCVTVLLVPVIVRVEEPRGVPLVVVTVSVELPDPPLMVAGEKVPVAPAGNPPTLNVTVSVKPPEAVMLVVKLVEPPGTTVWVLGLADSVKVG